MQTPQPLTILFHGLQNLLETYWCNRIFFIYRSAHFLIKVRFGLNWHLEARTETPKNCQNIPQNSSHLDTINKSREGFPMHDKICMWWGEYGTWWGWKVLKTVFELLPPYLYIPEFFQNKTSQKFGFSDTRLIIKTPKYFDL